MSRLVELWPVLALAVVMFGLAWSMIKLGKDLKDRGW